MANHTTAPPDGNDVPTRKNGSPTVRIREMDIDDLATVFHLGEELFKPDDVPSLYRTWDQHEVAELFNSDSELCLVAEVDGRFAGFALGTTIDKERSAWKYGHLVWLGVVPGDQRLGIGERLFRRMRDLMVKDGVRMLVVDTDAENDSALSFFARMGFGNPQKHVYLSLNLAGRQQRAKKARENRGPNHD